MAKKLLFFSGCLFLTLLSGCNDHDDNPVGTSHDSMFFIDYRDLNGGSDGMAVIELDPESPNFGNISSRLELGVGVLPHHIYYDYFAQRLYTTALGGSYLYQIRTVEDANGLPTLVSATPINTGTSTVGEDIFFTSDNRYFVTFMGGDGSLKGGSVGVFNATNNQLIKTISGAIDVNPNKFIMYPHGISISEEKELMMVTSTIHPDLTSGVGNTCTLIDLNTHEMIETYTVADSPSDMSSPVEVLLLRGQFPKFALTTTMLGGDIWMAPYNPTIGKYDAFTKAFDGSTMGLGWALEMYMDNNKQLYVSFGVPGKVLVFDISELPTLRLLRTLDADEGAHHMVFFKTKSGRDVVVVQNNLLNFPNLNSGTITVVDVKTGEKRGKVDLRNRYSILPESIEGTGGPSNYLLH